MTKKTRLDVAAERERQNKSDLKSVRTVAKEAGKIAESTSAYAPQRKRKPNWLKPPKH